MQFDPNNVKEFAQSRPGTFAFRVVEAEEKYSQNGNEMIALKLAILIDGLEATCYENLVNSEHMLWRTKAFCRCVGKMDKWESGYVSADDFAGARGVADFVLGEETTTARGTKFKPLKANIWRLPGTTPEGPATKPQATPKDDAPTPEPDIDQSNNPDDIPF